MNFTETEIPGAYLITTELHEDNRGFFARAWCREEFERQGLVTDVQQCNISFTKKAGTIRGLHYQIAPHEEVKIIRCTNGGIFDVCIDIRKDSETFGKWVGYELTAENRAMLYVPEGCAHGFQALTNNAEISYIVTAAYNKEAECGIRYDDPTLNISWPLDAADISEKDQNLPLLDQA